MDLLLKVFTFRTNQRRPISTNIMNKAKYNPAFGRPFAPKPIIERIKESSSSKRPTPVSLGRPLDPRVGLQLRNPTRVDTQVDMWKDNLFKQKQKVAEATRPESTRITSSTTPSQTTSTSKEASTTTSSYKPETTTGETTMAKRNGNNGNNRNNGERQNNSSGYVALPKALYPPKDNSINQNDSMSNWWFPDVTTDQIAINEKTPNPLFLDQSERPKLSGQDIIHKVMINQSDFASMFQATAAQNPLLFDELMNIYDRMSIDLLNSAKGLLYQDWTFDNWRNAMYWVCHALEAITTFDSIVGYDPKQSDFYDINKTAEAYRNVFTGADNLNARQSLRAALKGSWFPPDLAALIRWFFQYYRVNDLSQTSFYRFVPFDSFIPVNGAVPDMKSKFDAIRTNLVTPTNQRIFAMLSKAYTFGNFRTIPAGRSEAQFDDLMLEVFANDSVHYPAASGDVRFVHPIGHTDTRNDITYYQNKNPHIDDNGLAFALQCIFRSVSANGNVVPTGWNGIRKVTPSGAGARYTNRWSLGFNASGQITSEPRHTTLPMSMGTSDSHVYVLSGTTATTLSKCNTGFQRVYYNNIDAPQSHSARLIQSLFGTLPPRG